MVRVQDYDEGSKGKEIQLATATVKPGQRKPHRMGISLSKREKQQQQQRGGAAGQKSRAFANGSESNSSSSNNNNRRASTIFGGGGDDEEKKSSSSSSKKSKPKHQGALSPPEIPSHQIPTRTCVVFRRDPSRALDCTTLFIFIFIS